MATAHELVARGAELLDARLPGWADQIDLESLRMEDGCQCVLGQLGERLFNLDAASWHQKMRDRRGGPFPLSPYEKVARRLKISPRDCGFTEPWDQPDEDEDFIGFPELQDAWKGEIVARRTL